MILTLRLNHFFRSSWCIEKMEDFDFYDVKYLDLSILTKFDIRQWYVDFHYKNDNTEQAKDMRRILLKRKRCRWLDVSYWDTYNVHKMGFSNFDTGSFGHGTSEDRDTLEYLQTIDRCYTDVWLSTMIRNIYTMDAIRRPIIRLFGAKNHRTDNADYNYIFHTISVVDPRTYKNNKWKLYHMHLPSKVIMCESFRNAIFKNNRIKD
jgi:hypothetical protein